MAAAFGTNPPPEPPGFVPARTLNAESGHAGIAPAAELPARMNA